MTRTIGLLLVLMTVRTALADEAIPEGFLAHPLPVDPDGPIGDVRRGNYVDLVLLRPKGKGTEALIVLQNVYVLAADPETLSVMVTAQESAALTRDAKTGVFRVALRSLWEGNTQVPLEKGPGGSLPFVPLPLRK